MNLHKIVAKNARLSSACIHVVYQGGRRMAIAIDGYRLSIVPTTEERGVYTAKSWAEHAKDERLPLIPVPDVKLPDLDGVLPIPTDADTTILLDAKLLYELADTLRERKDSPWHIAIRIPRNQVAPYTITRFLHPDTGGTAYLMPLSLPR